MFKQARITKPRAHKGPLNAYFLSTYADTFKNFADIHQPHLTIPLPTTPNLTTLIIPDKEKAVKSIQDLKVSEVQVIV